MAAKPASTVAIPSAAEDLLRRPWAGVGLALVLFSLTLLLAGTPARAAEELFPQPAELLPDIRFWIRVYTEIGTTDGFIHDQRSLAVVYDTVHFSADQSPRERQFQVDAVRERYQGILRYLAAGGPPRDAEDVRVRALWPVPADAARLQQAVDEVRFQQGQSDRFRAGLIRAGAMQQHIAATFSSAGLPPELALLPHVESSFDPDAQSKVGAAGLWQFMRSTGRRFLRIDNAVDERFDPYRSTEAAAQLLAYNYRALGTWPLAVTAYNHGAEGMRRARDRVGTDDIVRIVRDYSSPLFGFASRNFYVCFLAASTVARDPARYFGDLKLRTPVPFSEIPLQSAATMPAITRALEMPADALKPLNPALRPEVWSGRRAVPARYRLRVPAGGRDWNSASLAAALNQAPAPTLTTPAVVTTTPAVAIAQAEADEASAEAAAAANSTDAPAAALAVNSVDLAVGAGDTIRVAAGETLGHYADWAGVSAAQLRRLNNFGTSSSVVVGRRLQLDLSGVDRATFERRRREYHQRLQAEFFASHRIIGSRQYLAQAGDSLWSVARRQGGVPQWLVQQYNPDLDFNNLKPGMRIIVPEVESLPDV
jgi:LysM repeat protein